MYPTSQISAKIETDGTPISLRDLSYFFYLFRALYVAGYREMPDTSQLGLKHSHQARLLAKSIVHQISDNPRHFADFATETLSEAEDIRIIDIHRQNPLSIIFAGIPVVIMAATIVAGGVVALNTDEVKLPTLRAAITNMRSAVYDQRK